MTNKFENYEHLALKKLVDGFRYELVSEKSYIYGMYSCLDFGGSVWLITAYNENGDTLLHGYLDRCQFDTLCICSNLIENTYYINPQRLRNRFRHKRRVSPEHNVGDFEELLEYFKQIVPSEYYEYSKEHSKNANLDF